MYDELVKRLRMRARLFKQINQMENCIMDEAADAIEELSRQRNHVYARLCEWCGVCSEGKRNPQDCEIAALNPEPPKEDV